jgi:hypothetical protein
MDACASWNDSQNRICDGIIFVLAWTDYSEALAEGAKGSCYVKAATDGAWNLQESGKSVETHSAILIEEDEEGGAKRVY